MKEDPTTLSVDVVVMQNDLYHLLPYLHIVLVLRHVVIGRRRRQRPSVPVHHRRGVKGAGQRPAWALRRRPVQEVLRFQDQFGHDRNLAVDHWRGRGGRELLAEVDEGDLTTGTAARPRGPTNHLLGGGDPGGWFEL